MQTYWSKRTVFYIRGIISYELDVVMLKFLNNFAVLVIYFSSKCGIGTHNVSKRHHVFAKDND